MADAFGHGGNDRRWPLGAAALGPLLRLLRGFGSRLGQADDVAQRSEAVKTSIFETALDAVISIDSAGHIVEFNPSAERMFGYQREDVLGKEMAALIIPETLRDAHRTALRRVVAGEEARLLGQRLELTATHSDGTEFPVELSIARVESQSRHTALFTGFIRDITSRKELERERASLLVRERDARRAAEAAQQQTEFIAEVGTVLDTALDYERALEELARIAVPRLGDWCVIDVLEEDGSIARYAAAHANPERRELIDALRDRYPADPNASQGLPLTIRTGESQLIPVVTDEMLDVGELAQDEEHARIMRELGFRSALVVPLRARGRILGAVGLALGPESDRRYGPDDLTYAEDLARRAALAIDNARLYRERSYIARTLQESLLPPELPEVAGAEIAARFHAAGEATEVGGDFYDMFDTSHGWGIVMGDVCGKGAGAAAVTALARYTLRTLGVQETSPAEILRKLNDALLQQRSDRRFCTVAYASLNLNGAGSADVCLSSGGHPLPYVLRADGTVEAVGEPGTLLGVLPEVRLSDTAVRLDRGDLLLLYTDGVTEARGPDGMFGGDELASVLASCAGLDAISVAARIESAALEIQEGNPRDDIAILAVRIR